MTTAEDTAARIDVAGVAAWTALAASMKHLGPARAWIEMLIIAPDAMMAVVTWMDRQPIERRMALCDELIGPVEEPLRH